MTRGNPFSRFLRSRLGEGAREGAAEALVEVWDRMEALVISVYRVGRASEEDERELAAIHGWMRANYSRYETDLRPHWIAVRAAGEQVEEDPLRSLWETGSAAQLVDSWAAMQLLPAARETLNRWLLSLERDRP